MELHLGIAFKLHRIEKGITTQRLAQLTKIPQSTISEFENENTRIPEEKVRNLYSALGLEAVFPKNTFSDTEQVVQQIFDDIVASNQNENTISELHKIKENVMFTGAYITWILGEFLYHVYRNNTVFDYEICIKCLKKYDYILSPAFRQIFYDTLGVYLKNQKRYDEALAYFRKGKELSVNNTTNAMIYYHTSMIYTNKGELSKALSDIKKSKKIFDKELNITRIIMTSVSLGIIYSLLGKYDEAEKVYLQCMKASKINKIGAEKVLYNNRIWNFICKEDYDKALKLGNEAYVNANTGSIYFYRSFSSYKLGEIDEAKNYIDAAKKFSHNCSDYMKAIISAFSYFLSPKVKVERKEMFLLKAFREAEKANDLQLQIFVLKIIIELDFSGENIQKAIDYRDQIIALLQKRQ